MSIFEKKKNFFVDKISNFGKFLLKINLFLVKFVKKCSIFTKIIKFSLKILDFWKKLSFLYFEENFVILKKIMHVWTHARIFLKKIMSILEGNYQFCTFLKKIWDFWNTFVETLRWDVCRKLNTFVEICWDAKYLTQLVKGHFVIWKTYDSTKK